MKEQAKANLALEIATLRVCYGQAFHDRVGESIEQLMSIGLNVVTFQNDLLRAKVSISVESSDGVKGAYLSFFLGSDEIGVVLFEYGSASVCEFISNSKDLPKALAGALCGSFSIGDQG
jgi:hypothetical protein